MAPPTLDAGGLSRTQLLELYYYARLTRDVEERLSVLYRQSQVVGGLYRSLGQEGESVAAAYALGPGDAVAPLIRNLGAILTRGVRPRDVFLQYMAKATSPTRGRDLNTHFSHIPAPGSDDPVIIGPISMLGDLVPVTAGFALGARLRGVPRVGLTFIGDGGTSTGAFHEGMNFAAVQKLAVVVVAEDNKYAYSTPVARQMAIDRIDRRADAYGIPHEMVDGNDMLAVFGATRRAVHRARAGQGPTLIGVDTMRMKGHAEHDDMRYVPAGLLEEWRARDPIARYRGVLLHGGAANEAELEEVDRLSSEYALTESREAEAAPMPDPATAGRGVFAHDAWFEPRCEIVQSPFGDQGSGIGDRGSGIGDRGSGIRDRGSGIAPMTTYLEAIRTALAEEMARDPRVFLIGEDIGTYGGAFKATEGLLTAFGESRVIDAPLSETAIVGAAVGAAYAGMRPVVEMQFIDFISCCFNILTNFAAKSRYRWGAGVPMVLRGPCGGGVGGGPFHSGNPEGYFVHTPGLKIVEPATAYDAKGLLKSAIRDDDPVLYLEHKFLYRRIKEDLPDTDFVVPIGQAAVRRQGSDASVITFGAMVHVALEAARDLEEAGVDLEVVDLRTLAPLDRDTVLASVAKTGKALVLHEAPRTGGIGGEVAAIVAEEAFEYLDGPVMRLASLDTPTPYSPPLEAAFAPDAGKVVDAVKRLVGY